MTDSGIEAPGHKAPSPEDTQYQWVNAVLTLTIPLDDVTVDSTNGEKMAAVSLAMDRLTDSLPPALQEFVGTAHWEDAEDV